MNTSLKTSLFAIALVLINFLPLSVEANDSVEETIEALLEQIQVLQSMIDQRATYADTGATTEGVQDYYYFENLTEDDLIIYGADELTLTFKTDADVLQLLVVADCATDVVLFDRPNCQRETWVANSVIDEWSRTYSVPVSFVGAEETASFAVTIYACRYNGCMEEQVVTMEYKNEKTFIDTVRIYDRYEWEFESGGDTVHTQEVLLDFLPEDLRKVSLKVDCDYKGLTIRTFDINTVSCADNVDYTRADFWDSATDDAGNTYNLAVSTVTNDIAKEQSGGVLLTFSFFAMNNRFLGTLEHRPVQKEVVAESEEDV